MMRWISALFLAALGLLTGSALAADCVVRPASASRPATLYAEPTSQSERVGTLSPGDSLPFVASLRGWYETRLADGKPAFAAKRSTDVGQCTDSVIAATDQSTFRLHAIDVGTGLSLFVRGSDFSLMYDAGSNDDLARGTDNRAIAYLKTLQPLPSRIDYVILSHPHRDHVELLPDVIKDFHPKEVWNSGAYNNICGYRDFLLAIAADPSIKYHTATQGAGNEEIQLPEKRCYGVEQAVQTLTLKHAERIGDTPVTLGKNASMTFLYADGSKRPSYNQNSLVVRLDLGPERVLFMGDAEAGGRKPPESDPSDNSIEGKLLACCAADLKADVLIVGHHGSETSSRKKFLDAVGAHIFIISSGPHKYSGIKLPDKVVVTELQSRGRVYETDLNDDACETSPAKVGPDDDERPGGCDNVLVTITSGGAITADYRRLAD